MDLFRALSGTTFLFLYALFIVAIFVFWRWFSLWRFTTPARDPEYADLLARLGFREVLALQGVESLRYAVLLTLMDLQHTGQVISVENEGEALKFGRLKQELSANESQLAGLLFAKLETPKSLDELLEYEGLSRALENDTQKSYEKLESLGLVTPAKDSGQRDPDTSALALGKWVLVALALIPGLFRLAAGLHFHRPSGFLMVILVVLALFGIWWASRQPKLTPKGLGLQTYIRKVQAAGNVTDFASDNTVDDARGTPGFASNPALMAVLFGSVALMAMPLYSAYATEFPSDQAFSNDGVLDNSSFSDGGWSGSDSSGSSDGGSDSGGSGCTGCGGGGD